MFVCISMYVCVCMFVSIMYFIYVCVYVYMYVCMVKILNSYQTPFKSSQSGGFNTLEESNCGCTFIFVAVYG